MQQDSTMDVKRGVFGAYSAIAVVSTLYALLLNTNPGKRFATEYTWASVSVGTGIVLLCSRLITPKTQWRKVGLAFIIGGLPMIGRSVLNKIG